MRKLISKSEEDISEKSLLDFKLREKAIKIRGVPESKGKEDEDILEKLKVEIAKFLETDPQVFENEIDNLYRINSAAARQKGYPRDTVIYFMRKRVRDKFLNLHNRTNFCFEGAEVKILKDVPGEILRRRKDYYTLTAWLRRKSVKYRWEFPEGLVFWWENKRIRILNVEQAKKFLKQTAITVTQNSQEEKDERGEEEVEETEEEDPQNPRLPELEYDEEELIREQRKLRGECVYLF